MTERTATNPQTGEKVVFRNGQWVPFEPTAQPAQQMGSGGSMGRGFAGSAIDNALNLPEAMLRRGVIQPFNDLMRPVVRAGETAAALATGDWNQFSTDPRFAMSGNRDLGINTGFNGNPNRENNAINVPPREQRILPQISSDDVFAGAQYAGEKAAQFMTGSDMPTSTFQQAQTNQRQITQNAQEQNPGAYLTGDIFGDIATITGMRQSGPAGVATSRELLRNLATMRATNLLEKARKSNTLSPRHAKTIKDAVSKLFANNRGLISAQRAGERVAEAGLEGAVLAMLDEGDPEAMFGYAAGTQIAGGLMLSGLTNITSGGLGKASMKLAAAGGATAALLQALDSAVPGGDDFILPNIESGFNKVTAFLALGALSGVAGQGRFPVRAIPEISDAITSLSRNGVQSIIAESTKDPSVEMVLKQVSTNPGHFGPKAQRLIYRAIQNPEVSLSDTINNLMDDRQFRIAMENIPSE